MHCMYVVCDHVSMHLTGLIERCFDAVAVSCSWSIDPFVVITSSRILVHDILPAEQGWRLGRL